MARKIVERYTDLFGNKCIEFCENDKRYRQCKRGRKVILKKKRVGYCG